MDPQQVQPLDYATPDTPKRRPPIDKLTAIAYMVAGATLTALLTYVTSSLLPAYKQIFEDFHTNLPDSTMLLLRFTSFFCDGYGWVAAWALGILGPLGLAWLVEQPQRETTRVMCRRLVWYFAFLFTVALTMFVVFATQWPFLSLISAVSGGPKR